MRDLAGRTAVVTGAGSGLGRAIAIALADSGMRVVLADIDLDAAVETGAVIRASGPDTLAVRTDVTDPAALDELARIAADRFGHVSLLVNNAGVAVAGPAWATPLADWHRALQVNLMGVVHGLRSFVPQMIADREDGHVVNTSSLAGLVSGPGMGGYCAGKHAVVALSECLHHDLRLARARIGVSVLCPGVVATGLVDAAHDRRAARQLARAGVTAEDVARQVVDAVVENRFYVFTHAGSDVAIERRLQAIKTGQAPRPPRL